MRLFSAQYIFTNTGTPLKRGIITTDDDGTILNVEDTAGNLHDRGGLEYFNGIIVPGFINSHCHLELSHLKGITKKYTGLGAFIEQVRGQRESDILSVKKASADADTVMTKEGVVLCADICNTDITFSIKKKSRIRYINLLEVFGIDPASAHKRINAAVSLASECNEAGLIAYIVPHAVYSTSLPLLKLIRENAGHNKVSSIHFLESEDEKTFLAEHAGPIAESYSRSGLLPSIPETPVSHEDAVLNRITGSGNLILVHNTFASREIADSINTRGNTYWCLCPGSNHYIEGKLPPAVMLRDASCHITIGTDSLASNDKLSMIFEMRMLQDNFPSLTLDEIIQWATLNGARALGEDETYGSIEPGKKPGLVLIGNPDLLNMRLLPETYSSRLI